MQRGIRLAAYALALWAAPQFAWAGSPPTPLLRWTFDNPFDGHGGFSDSSGNELHGDAFDRTFTEVPFVDDLHPDCPTAGCADVDRDQGIRVPIPDAHLFDGTKPYSIQVSFLAFSGLEQGAEDNVAVNPGDVLLGVAYDHEAIDPTGPFANPYVRRPLHLSNSFARVQYIDATKTEVDVMEPAGTFFELGGGWLIEQASDSEWTLPQPGYQGESSINYGGFTSSDPESLGVFGVGRLPGQGPEDVPYFAADGEWHSILISYQPDEASGAGLQDAATGEVVLVVDGVERRRRIDASMPPVFDRDGNPLEPVFSLGHSLDRDLVAEGQSGIRPAFAGLLDEFAVWDVALITNIPGDYNDDGGVNAPDFNVWRDSFGDVGPDLPADGNNDGIVGAPDYNIWRDNFGRGMVASGSVPEPTAIGLAALALIAQVARRRWS